MRQNRTYQPAQISRTPRADASQSGMYRYRQPAATPHRKQGRVTQRRQIGVVIALIVGMIGITQITNIADASDTIKQDSPIVHNTNKQPFPRIDETKLNTTQKRLLAVAKQEYAHGAKSYDAYVLKYNEGFQESWCANFVSWMMNEAKTPYKNKENSDYWRIPGVGTLLDYYDGLGAYHEVGTYTPEFGDVAFYFGETPDGSSTEHVAMVLKVEGDRLVTLGGNEGKDGIMRLRYDKLDENVKGLTGFGQSWQYK